MWQISACTVHEELCMALSTHLTISSPGALFTWHYCIKPNILQLILWIGGPCQLFWLMFCILSVHLGNRSSCFYL